MSALAKKAIMKGSDTNNRKETIMHPVLKQILDTFTKVILAPKDFFRNMPKTGGFVEPLTFAVVMGCAAGILQAVAALLGMSVVASAGMAFLSILFIPILIGIFGFVGAAILLVIWKVMGSNASYETAYRCGAYAGAVIPITTLLGIIPYLGVILGMAWMLYLMVVASVEVHGLKEKQAWIVFGILFGLMALSSSCSQYTGRKMEEKMGNLQERMEEMTPEEAGRAMGEFLKGLEQSKGKE